MAAPPIVWMAPAVVGEVLSVKLFVLGYTDTVGNSAANQALSVRRACAIAAYFRAAGVKIPIRYAGKGEDALLVLTPDETDEVRNRRARYLLAVETTEKVTWTPLRGACSP